MSETNNAALSADQLEALDSMESGFESVQPTFRTPGKNLMEGDTVTGAFVRSEPNKFKGQNYVLRTANGIEVLNGCGSLTGQINDAGVKEGDILKVTYEGKITLTKGDYKGKEAHQYSVKIKRIPR